MDVPKQYFERIPVATVKRIAQEFAVEKEEGDDSAGSEAPAAESEPPQRAHRSALFNGTVELDCLQRKRP